MKCPCLWFHLGGEEELCECNTHVTPLCEFRNCLVTRDENFFSSLELFNVVQQPALCRLHELKGVKMKKLFIKKSIFAVPLVVLFLTFLYPQTARADCPGDWWCPSDPLGDPQIVTSPNDPTSLSPGFDLFICYDLPCVTKTLGLPASGLTAPNVTISTIPPQPGGPNG